MKPLTPTESAEVNHLIQFFSGFAIGTTTTTKRIAHGLLQHEFVFCRGDMRDFRVKHLGVGVYKVWTEARS